MCAFPWCSGARPFPLHVGMDPARLGGHGSDQIGLDCCGEAIMKHVRGGN
jgi:hypothetical protein